MSAPHNGFLRFLGGFLKGLDITRKVIVDVVVLGIVALILIAIFVPEAPTVPDSAVLVIKPEGRLVEQVPNPVSRSVKKLIGRPVMPVTPVRNLVRALNTAAGDPHIKAVKLNLDHFAGGSMAQLSRVADAIKRFKQSGKPVFAYAKNYSQGSYYLAAYANEAYLTTSQGIVSLMGLAAYRNYYKELINKLKIHWHIFRVGKFKSFVEPYMRNSMSKAAEKETRALLDTLWTHYVKAVAKARGIKPAQIYGLVNHWPEALARTDGNAARLAVKKGLIDAIKPRSEPNVSLVAAASEVHMHNNGKMLTLDHSTVSMAAYLDARKPAIRIANRARGQVAIIVAQGHIVTGKAPPGTIGARTLSKLLSRAAHNNRVKAVVLDVNSPGGSAIASDIILHAELEFKNTGKPLVVSMAGVAASGGYWISMAADKIFASPVTITGSIGIFGMFPTFERTAAWIGIHRDGVKTAPLANFGDILQPVSDGAAKVFQLLVEHGYEEFTTNVAQYRGLPLSHVKAIAQGRVWSGQAAKRIGLIDEFGDLSEAVKAAARMANLEHYGVTYIEPHLSSTQQMIVNLAGDSQARSVATGLLGMGGGEHPLLETVRPMLKHLKTALSLKDPRGLYTYCFCEGTAQLR